MTRPRTRINVYVRESIITLNLRIHNLIRKEKRERNKHTRALTPWHGLRIRASINSRRETRSGSVLLVERAFIPPCFVLLSPSFCDNGNFVSALFAQEWKEWFIIISASISSACVYLFIFFFFRHLYIIKNTTDWPRCRPLLSEYIYTYRFRL